MTNPKLINLLVEKKIKYDLKNLGGGFKDGVEVAPGQGDLSNTIMVSATLYGGGTKEYHNFSVPKKIAQDIAAHRQAVADNDPIASDIEQTLNQYYDEINKEISLSLVRLMRALDRKAYQLMQTAVNNVNSRYESATSTQSRPSQKPVEKPTQQLPPKPVQK